MNKLENICRYISTYLIKRSVFLVVRLFLHLNLILILLLFPVPLLLLPDVPIMLQPLLLTTELPSTLLQLLFDLCDLCLVDLLLPLLPPEIQYRLQGRRIPDQELSQPMSVERQ